MNLLQRIRTALHRHQWDESAWNPYWVARERRCKCGARQHRVLRAVNGDGPWMDGEDPGAANLRKQGKVFSDDWGRAA